MPKHGRAVMFIGMFSANAHTSARGEDDPRIVGTGSPGLLELPHRGAWHLGSLGLHACFTKT